MTTAIMINLINRLRKVEYTHNYIMGFIYKGMVYSYMTMELSTGVKLDKASSKNGGGYSLRFNPTVKEKNELVASGICKVICTEEMFNNIKETTKYNKGEIFEKLITERFNVEWKKDNVRVDKGADVEINGKAYSIKFQKATITTETVLNNIESGK